MYRAHNICPEDQEKEILILNAVLFHSAYEIFIEKVRSVIHCQLADGLKNFRRKNFAALSKESHK